MSDISPVIRRDAERLVLDDGREFVRKDIAEAEIERLREEHERDLIQVREAHAARRLAEAAYERLREALTRMATPGEFERGPEFRRFAREVLEAHLHDPWVMDQ